MNVKNRIIKEASTHFFKKGVRGVSMDFLAASLLISKRTIYENFKDKKELIEICIAQTIADRREKLDKIGIDSDNVIDAIFKSIKVGVHSIRLFKPIFFSEVKKYYPKLFASLRRSAYKDIYNTTYKLLRRGINEQIFRKDINLAIVSKIFVEQLNLLTDRAVFPPEEFSLTEVFENMVINFVRGICTPKGLDLVEKH